MDSKIVAYKNGLVCVLMRKMCRRLSVRICVMCHSDLAGRACFGMKERAGIFMFRFFVGSAPLLSSPSISMSQLRVSQSAHLILQAVFSTY